MRTFRSDNNAGLCSEAMQALAQANDASHEIGYGDDSYSARAVAAFERLFDHELAAYFVATGTAANTLAVAALTEPWQRVVCHRHSHFNDDESTAPERLTQCRIHPVDTRPDKITPEDVERVLANSRGDVHQPSPGIVTISNSTEFGTVYQPQEIQTLCEAAHKGGFRVHMDGARFANAVASVGCTAAELTCAVGLDALSFGGTKNGLAYGEAVLFFRQGDGRAFDRAVETFEHHRKGTGHLLSKHRFVSAPFEATLADDIWLKHARHANDMATRLAAGLRDAGLEPAFDVESNGIFVALPSAVNARLEQAGHGYYPFGDAAQGLYRLMCSFDTTPEEVDSLLADVKAAV